MMRFVVTTVDIASCEHKNCTDLSQSSQRNEVVTTCIQSYKLLLQIAPSELTLTFCPIVHHFIYSCGSGILQDIYLFGFYLLGLARLGLGQKKGYEC